MIHYSVQTWGLFKWVLNSGHMHTNKSHNNLIVMTLIEQQYQMTLILNSVCILFITK